jgi:26S proteasome regulatory subunit N2
LDVSQKSEYVDTLLAKCIDQYKVLRIQKETDENISIDPRMEAIIEQMFQRCYNDHCFEQAIGVALDTHRIDKIDEICVKAIAVDHTSILNYAFNLCQSVRNITSREFRLSVIDILVKLYARLPHPDFSNMCYGLQYLNRPAEVAHTLEQLCKGSLEETLQAYQICFDLQEAENQGFVLQIVSELTEPIVPISTTSPPAAVNVIPPQLVDHDDSEEDGMATESSPLLSHDQPDMSQDDAGVSPLEYKNRMDKLKRVLTEGFDVDLILSFLFKQSKADINVLKSIKSATESTRSSILHNATVVAHAYMFSGTTIDTFLRENLDWLGKATNWNKFTAVASIGVVHKGHVHESMNLLQPYLPQAGQSNSPYSESGALYALGLIHANKGGRGDSKVISYLSEALRNSGTNDVVQHGACLGIGLAAMATGNPTLFEELRQVLFMDNASAGEGAALAVGLLMVGQSDSSLAQSEIPNLLNAAHDSPHEKIVRALALSISMMVYGKEESADVLIEQLSRDRDPIIRYGASYAIAMAYCGTSDNDATRKLLHVAVSDVNDDVRRSAVTCIGFVSFRNPEIVPKLVVLLAESFNPHVRYGACMAVGIACAGLANKEAIDLLTPMMEDPIDFVRQGALISMAFVLQQCAEARSPSVKKFRDHLMAVLIDKHQTIMTKTGAILASGIIDAGGRNVVVNLQSRAGFLKMGGAVGLMMFMQYWHWYPLMHMLSLAFAPTALIGLNKDFNIPTNFSVVCYAPPSMFAYPKAEEKKEDEKKTVTTAVLSTTVKAKAREARKEARKFGNSYIHS